jgi:hypothetical protein
MSRNETAAVIPSLVRYISLHGLFGMGLGCCAAMALLFFDVAGLGTLVIESGTPTIAIALLVGGFGLTFGSLAMGSAIMLIPDEHETWVRPILTKPSRR